MSTSPLLQVENLVVTLQREKRTFRVVDRLSFDLYRGKTLALVGESGSGKTMTAFSLLRLLPAPAALPPQGKVLYRGKNLFEASEKEMRRIRGGKIAMIFQNPSGALNPVYSIGAQMLEAAETHLGLFGEEAIERAAKALADVGISAPRERLADYPHQLSGGMKQRAMIAMALLCEPEILIADEPTTALDVTIQAQVLHLIRDLQRHRGLAVLLITHDMGVVAENADDVVVMYAAQSVEAGKALDIFDQKAHPYTKGLFHSLPNARGEKKRLQSIKGMIPSLLAPPPGCRFHPRCPYVMPKCLEGDVPYFVLPEEGHFAKCRLYDASEESRVKLEEKKEDA